MLNRADFDGRMAEVEVRSEVTAPPRHILLISAGANHSVALLCKHQVSTSLIRLSSVRITAIFHKVSVKGDKLIW